MRVLLRVPAVILGAFAAFTAASGLLYPFLRPDLLPTLGHPLTSDPLLDGAWGGTTLVGAWAAHAGVALAILLPVVLLMRWLWRTGARRTPASHEADTPA
ncbi:hypothetical protein [Microbispora bryophytorum]|uniref:Uncharacterized protein n=1 Tax=Microbispora bryophytorum TaxID=1460882 RepID=A0A8H9GZX0_9ACTN|nr:hypothetical protein [Microbispora bryophytorum]MBD3137067.1 hypothetical protein [Microbispora bryophytorum]TQS07318.1 hypothetical protein FLX07_11610 [Microbispora bryophytorum]GGO14310.1 hypothetical protein GCM10011574_34570 [Microbispora bryophytorum]